MSDIVKPYKVAIVGGGNIGSRHGQAVAQLSNCHLQVFDLDPRVFDLCRSRFIEAGGDIAKITCHTEIHDIDESTDLVIIATTSIYRLSVIKSVLELVVPKHFICEKVLFLKNTDYEEMSKLIQNHNLQVWVNTNRREMTEWRIVKNRINEGCYYHLLVTGTNWGLCCNLIHHVDLALYLNDVHELTKVNFQGNFTDTIVDAKRKPYKETFGTVKVFYEGREIATITCVDEGLSPKTKTQLLTCDTLTSEVLKQEDIPFEQYVSQTTAIAINSIMQTGSCMLPNYAFSMAVHKKMLDMFRPHFASRSIEMLIT